MRPERRMTAEADLPTRSAPPFCEAVALAGAPPLIEDESLPVVASAAPAREEAA